MDGAWFIGDFERTLRGDSLILSGAGGRQPSHRDGCGLPKRFGGLFGGICVYHRRGSDARSGGWIFVSILVYVRPIRLMGIRLLLSEAEGDPLSGISPRCLMPDCL